MSIKRISIEEARERVKSRKYKSLTPSIYEVYREKSSRGELVRMPNGNYRIYKEVIK